VVGVVWREDLQLPNLTVKETVHFAPRLKTPKHRSDKDLNLLLETVALEHPLGALGGEFQVGRERKLVWQ
jgi:ABC-type multidrug transport system ATPase subunit